MNSPKTSSRFPRFCPSKSAAAAPGSGWRAALALAALFAMPASGMAAPPVPAAPPAAQVSASGMSESAAQVSDWIRGTNNHKSQAFAIIDKKNAALHVFDREGTKLASSPVLLGLAVGDASVPGIGERKMSQILPEERTTPAGRFVTEPGVNPQGKDIVWIDYDAAVSMHRVVTANKAERRLERLATPGVADKRISYGCVNVPVAFYDKFIKPVFGLQPAVIYVLPETSEASAFFNMEGSAPTTLAAGKGPASAAD